MRLPTLGERRFVSDGGLETDLIHHRGVDLPHFAAFPLVASAPDVLADYYSQIADIARRADAGLFLEAPTWRANPDWAAQLGYDAAALDRVNQEAIRLMQSLRSSWTDLEDVVVCGLLGPRGDGYVAGERADVDEAAAYHRPQLESFARAGADMAAAYTLTGVDEALGIARAANGVGVPIAISFTVETDGRLPDGTSLGDAITRVDAAGEVLYFGVNCAHPTHIAPALADGAWRERIGSLMPNASVLTHAELDDMDDLDEGDPTALAEAVDALRSRLPELAVLGGCCGTDHRHVATMWRC